MAVMEENDSGTKQALIENLSVTQETLVEEAQRRLEEVWMAILIDAILDCPFVTGTLMSTVTLSEGGTGTDTGEAFGGGGGEYGISIYDATIVAGNPNVTKPNGEPCIYAEFVHDGSFNVRTQKMNIAQPWLENAIDKHETELDAAIEQMMEAIGAD